LTRGIETTYLAVQSRELGPADIGRSEPPTPSTLKGTLFARARWTNAPSIGSVFARVGARD